MVMIKHDLTNYYKKEEFDKPDRRELRLFKDFNKKLIKICKLSDGWHKILNEIDLNEIRCRDDLEKLPIVRKSDLPNIQSQNLPFGGLSTKDPLDFPYIFASPGPIYEPGNNNDFWDLCSCLYSAGLRKESLVYNTFSYHLGPAGIMFSNSIKYLGASVIAGGIGNTDIQLETIKNLKPDFYIGTPSFLKILLEKAEDKKINITSIKNGVVGAEPLPNSLRKSLKNKGVEVMQMYGTAEVGCIAYESKNAKKQLNEGMIVEENIILEIVRPGTNFRVKDGDVGEVVVTKITNDYPMIRLATGDLSAIIKDLSPCGRTNIRIKGWMGRAEQSTKFKGIFITPNQVNSLLKQFKEVSKVKFIINNENHLDKGELICETEKISELLKESIKNYFKSANKINVEVKLVKIDNLSNDGIVIEDKRSHK